MCLCHFLTFAVFSTKAMAHRRRYNQEELGVSSIEMRHLLFEMMRILILLTLLLTLESLSSKQSLIQWVEVPTGPRGKFSLFLVLLWLGCFGVGWVLMNIERMGEQLRHLGGNVKRSQQVDDEEPTGSKFSFYLLSQSSITPRKELVLIWVSGTM